MRGEEHGFYSHAKSGINIMQSEHDWLLSYSGMTNHRCLLVEQHGRPLGTGSCGVGLVIQTYGGDCMKETYWMMQCVHLRC